MERYSNGILCPTPSDGVSSLGKWGDLAMRRGCGRAKGYRRAGSENKMAFKDASHYNYTFRTIVFKRELNGLHWLSARRKIPSLARMPVSGLAGVVP
jgi:hypothetical protein